MDPRPNASRPEPAQRWRLTAARSVEVSRRTQRETTAAWESSVVESGLPFVPVGDGSSERPRLQFGAAIPTGVAAEAEWLDVLLAERWPRWRVREALEPRVPEGWRLVDLEDVWLGGPALGGLIAAADYRVTLDRALDVGTIRDACLELLAARTLPREREKGGGLVVYDLRPLLLDVAVIDPGPPITLRIRARIDPSLGSGRPDEVVAALASATGGALAASSITRERLLLAEDPRRGRPRLVATRLGGD